MCGRRFRKFWMTPAWFDTYIDQRKVLWFEIFFSRGTFLVENHRKRAAGEYRRMYIQPQKKVYIKILWKPEMGNREEYARM